LVDFLALDVDEIILLMLLQRWAWPPMKDKKEKMEGFPPSFFIVFGFWA